MTKVLPDTYVACAMSALEPREYEKVRKAVLGVCETLRSMGREPYSEPYETEAALFEDPNVALKKNLVVLDASTLFVLIYTHKEATSALIELGYALARNIPIVIFSKQGVKLPYYLRQPYIDGERSIQVHTFDNYTDLSTLLNTSF